MGSAYPDGDKVVIDEMPVTSWIDDENYKRNKQSTKILYATDGSLINQLNEYPYRNKFI